MHGIAHSIKTTLLKVPGVTVFSFRGEISKGSIHHVGKFPHQQALAGQTSVVTVILAAASGWCGWNISFFSNPLAIIYMWLLLKEFLKSNIIFPPPFISPTLLRNYNWHVTSCNLSGTMCWLDTLMYYNRIITTMVLANISITSHSFHFFSFGGEKIQDLLFQGYIISTILLSIITLL